MANAEANMRPAVLDLLLYAGDGTAATVRFKDGAGAAVDVSAYTWAATWRPERASADTLKIALTIDQTGASSGNVIVHFTAAATRAMSATGYWDLQGVIGAGDPTTAVTGRVSVENDVTR